MRQWHGLLMAAGFAFALAAGVVILRSRRAQPPASVATKTAGRLLSVVVQEGDLVRAGSAARSAGRLAARPHSGADLP